MPADYRLGIKRRIVSILEEITVSGLTLTVAPNVPSAKQDFEGFVLYTYIERGTQRLASSTNYDNQQQWSIVILGNQVGMNLRGMNEDDLLTVADKVAEKFNNRRQLQDGVTKKGLTGIREALLVGEQLNAPAPYPVGQAQNEYYSYRFTLQISFLWSQDVSVC